MIQYPINRPHYVFTSESVSEGHPDKVCDQISDSIVDALLAENPTARAAIEVLATTNQLIIAGETRGAPNITKGRMDDIAREKVREIGYNQEGFHWHNLDIHNYVHEQSTDIAMGVDANGDKDEGAGDQGIMFGFACDETPDLMPASIKFANQILQNLSAARHAGAQPMLGPDAKSQVSLYYEEGKPLRCASIVVSTQHSPDIHQADVREIVRQYVQEAIPKGWMCDEEEFYVNPTGQFIIGGPDGDAGLTGRKIIVDTYGGAAPHGGGAFSGKDPSKVDRSAAYAARYLAKNVVAAGLAERCLIQLSYAIGVSHPISFFVSTHGTGKVSDGELETLLPKIMELSPRGIRHHLGLNKPIYCPTATYGHFGREAQSDGRFSWERLDLVDTLRREFGERSKNCA